VVRVDVVDRHRVRHDLRLAAPALREERADRTVDHARGERALLSGTALALEEAAGDLARGVHALLHVDRQREEVHVADVPRRGSGENHRLALSHYYSTARLLGELAGLEGDLLTSDLDGDPAHISAHMFLSLPPPVGGPRRSKTLVQSLAEVSSGFAGGLARDSSDGAARIPAAEVEVGGRPRVGSPRRNGSRLHPRPAFNPSAFRWRE